MISGNLFAFYCHAASYERCPLIVYWDQPRLWSVDIEFLIATLIWFAIDRSSFCKEAFYRAHLSLKVAGFEPTGDTSQLLPIYAKHGMCSLDADTLFSSSYPNPGTDVATAIIGQFNFYNSRHVYFSIKYFRIRGAGKA